MKKKQIRVFGHNYYLLGTYKDGKKYYIQEPTWDCGWYWGGIYINSFTNKLPSLSVSISSRVSYLFILACNAVLGTIRVDEQTKKIEELEKILDSIDTDNKKQLRTI